MKLLRRWALSTDCIIMLNITFSCAIRASPLFMRWQIAPLPLSAGCRLSQHICKSKVSGFGCGSSYGARFETAHGPTD